MNGDRGEGPPGAGSLDSEPALPRGGRTSAPIHGDRRHDRHAQPEVAFVARFGTDARALVAVELDQRPMTPSPLVTLECDEDAL